MIENNDTDDGGQIKHHPTSAKRPSPKSRQQQQKQQDKDQTSGTNGVEETIRSSTSSMSGGNNNRCITCFRLLRDWRGNQLAKYYDTKSNLIDLLEKDTNRNLVVDTGGGGDDGAANYKSANNRVIELIKTYLISSSANQSSRNTRYVRSLLSNIHSTQSSCSPKVCQNCFECLNQIDNHMQNVQRLCSLMRGKLDKSCRLIKRHSNASRSKMLTSRRKRRVVVDKNAAQYNKMPRNLSDLNGWSYHSSLFYLPKHINNKLTVCVDTDRSDAENGSITSSLISPPLRKYAMIDANDFELHRDQSKTSKFSEDNDRNCLDHSTDKNFLSPNSSTNRRKRKSGNPSRFSHELLHTDVNNNVITLNNTNIHQSKENNNFHQATNNKHSHNSIVASDSISAATEYAPYSNSYTSAKSNNINNNSNNKVMNLRYRNTNSTNTNAIQQQRTTSQNNCKLVKKLFNNNTLNADNTNNNSNNNDYDEQQMLMQNRINMMKRNLDQMNSNKHRLVTTKDKQTHDFDLDMHTSANNNRSNKENDNSSENYEVYHITNTNDEVEEEEDEIENGNGTEYDDDGNMMYLKVKDDNEHHHHHNHHHSRIKKEVISGEFDDDDDGGDGDGVEASDIEDEDSKFCEIEDEVPFEYTNLNNEDEAQENEQSFDIMQGGDGVGFDEDDEDEVDEYEEEDDEDADETFQIKGITGKSRLVNAPPKLTKHFDHLTDVEKRKNYNRSKADILSGDGVIKNFISSALTNAVQSGSKNSGDALYTKHTCNVCKKSFKTQNILRQHMRIHTGDKPFVCDICQKAFSQMASLKYHLATHSDDRPFKCEDCSKTFKLKPPFKKHIKECPQRLLKLEQKSSAVGSGSSSSINSKKPSAVVSSSSSISSSSPLYFKTGIKDLKS